MNLGLAYMVTTPQTEAKDRFSNFDFYTGKIYVGGTIGVKTDYSNIQPRVGFAWSPFSSTNMVLRGGYGIYHDVSAMGGSTGPYQNPPYANAYSFTSDNITPVRTLATGFPNNSTPTDPNTIHRRMDHDRPELASRAVIQQWSLNVERKLPCSTVVERRLCRQLRGPLVRQEPGSEHGPPWTGFQHPRRAAPIRSCRASSPR